MDALLLGDSFNPIRTGNVFVNRFEESSTKDHEVINKGTCVGDLCKLVDARNVRAFLFRPQGRIPELSATANAWSYIQRRGGPLFLQNDDGKKWLVYPGVSVPNL